MADVCVLPEYADTHLTRQLRAFYTEDCLRHLLIPLIDQTSVVSLRTLDWLCVNLSKRDNIVCSKPDGGLCNIYNDYKVALSVYRRASFDPLRRRTRGTVRLDGMEYVTTLGQCNFVYWAWTHGVLQYARQHASLIECDMNAFSSAHRSELRDCRRQGRKRKRCSLSARGRSVCRIYAAPTRETFDLLELGDA